MNKANSYRIQVLDRAFQILDNLSEHAAGLGVTELAERVGLHKSTAHRLIMVLESNRFVERDVASGKCRLGSRLMQLGLSALARVDVCEAARPHLRSLVDETGETAHLGVMRDGEVISLIHADSNRNLRTPITVGARTPVHCTSLGKAMLAFAPTAEIDAFLRGRTLKAHTRHTLTSGARLREDLRVTRRRGYSIDDQEREEGLRCIGAPVWDALGAVVAAISIAGPVFRVTEDRTPAFAEALMGTAARIAAALGYSPKGRRT